jgi:hypothetical protein
MRRSRRRHADHPQREHRQQRDQEQRKWRHVGNPLAERDHELKQQIITACLRQARGPIAAAVRSNEVAVIAMMTM